MKFTGDEIIHRETQQRFIGVYDRFTRDTTDMAFFKKNRGNNQLKLLF